jgi:glucosyl-3-phosphoglycerate synthase
MADFYQHGRLPTLHHLAESDVISREVELVRWSKERPIALLLPAFFLEFQRSALPRMLREISSVPYISEVILSINGTTREELDVEKAIARECLGDKPCRLLWNDGPEAQAIYRQVQDLGGPSYHAGKGSNIWMGVLHLAARAEHAVVACHDTDIMSYERGMLWRLCYPVANPDMPYRFAKGYYGRVGERLYGRVTRLLVAPLLRAFRDVVGSTDLVRHLASFRYPLSGEFSASLDSLARFPMPPGWGLEVCLLCELIRHLKVEEMCQVDLGFNFEHRHREVSTAPAASSVAATGLENSATEVARALAYYILADKKGGAFGLTLREVADRYAQVAAEWVPRYEHDALFNGLRYDRDDELRAVEIFVDVLSGLHREPGSLPNWPAPQQVLQHAAIRDAVKGLGMRV